jgi:hypothetical protein
MTVGRSLRNLDSQYKGGRSEIQHAKCPVFPCKRSNALCFLSDTAHILETAVKYGPA